jgi:hypothetical protein
MTGSFGPICLFLILFGLGAAFDFFVLRSTAKRWPALLFWIQALIYLPLPLLIPSSLTLVRFVACILVALKVVRTADLVFNRVYDRAMLQGPRFFVWFLAGGDSRWPATVAEKQTHRKLGLAMVIEGTLYTLLLGVATFALRYFPTWPDHFLSRYVTLLLLLGLGLPAFSGLANGGTTLLLGVHVFRSMNHPLLATSLRDFWGRRWNITFRDLAHRHIFIPLLARGAKPWVAALCVFAASAFIHEYLVLMCAGAYVGMMTAFFMLHGVLCIAEQRFSKSPLFQHCFLRWVWTWAALIVTAPLFFIPFLQIIPIVAISQWLNR